MPLAGSSLLALDCLVLGAALVVAYTHNTGSATSAAVRHHKRGHHTLVVTDLCTVPAIRRDFAAIYRVEGGASAVMCTDEQRTRHTDPAFYDFCMARPGLARCVPFKDANCTFFEVLVWNDDPSRRPVAFTANGYWQRELGLLPTPDSPPIGPPVVDVGAVHGVDAVWDDGLQLITPYGSTTDLEVDVGTGEGCDPLPSKAALEGAEKVATDVELVIYR